MSSILQISDPHFGTERAPVVRALLRFAQAENPELVVLSGDITQRARVGQFAAAQAFVAELSAPAVLAIPGNHDIPLFNLLARAFFPYANYRRVFGPELDPVHESADFLVLGVNTTRPHRHKDGEISRRQIQTVATRLRDSRGAKVRVVVVHQPVLAVCEEDETNLLHGREEAIQAWSAAGADIVMGGHIHLPYVRDLRDAYAYLPNPVWTVQAGTSVSSRTRQEVPNSVNVVRSVASAPRRCVAERWDYKDVVDRFELHSTHEMVLG